MALGYDGKLYILAFDHRGSFQKKMFGIQGDPTPEETARIVDAKHLIYEGMTEAVSRGAEASATGVLVDEQFGGTIPEQAHAAGLKLAMPVEKSGENHFDFEYGDDFGAHILKFNPDFSKVLVRYNPEDPDVDMNREQLIKLKRLADWLHEHDRKFLFELLVPATEAQLAKVDGAPPLRHRTAAGADAPHDRGDPGFGCEVDIWKIEGVDERSDAEILAKQARSGEGRAGVTCVLLGRGASTEKVEQWLQAASTVDGFIGFAIGRSIWWDALKGFLAEDLDRAAAASQIADNYLHFVEVYEGQKVA